MAAGSYATCFTGMQRNLHILTTPDEELFLSKNKRLALEKTIKFEQKIRAVIILNKTEIIVLSIVRFNFYLNKEYTTFLFDPTINGKILLRTSTLQDKWK
jgi:hypothetical protein